MACDEGCIEGSIHSGSPQGKEELIHGLNTYIIGNRTSPRGIIVIYSDVFGLAIPNCKLIADRYANSGNWLVYVPDFFQGDPMPLNFPDGVAPVGDGKQSSLSVFSGFLASKKSLVPWSQRHGFEPSNALFMEFMTALRRATPLAQKIGTVGFCWGGRYAIRAAQKSATTKIDDQDVPLVHAAVALHPSQLELPDDVHHLGVPVAFGWGEEDANTKIELMDKIKAIHKEEDSANTGSGEQPEMEHKVYKPGRHGFAVRGDPDDPVQKADLKESEKQATDWFEKWL